MTDREITALAREYAEEKGRKMEMEQNLPNCLIKEVMEMDAQELTNFLQWLLRRFCLVEKDKVREAYKDAQKDQHNSERDFALTLAGRNRSAVLIDIFPEIGKEVEG